MSAAFLVGNIGGLDKPRLLEGGADKFASEVSLDRLAYRPTQPGVLQGPHDVVEGDTRECVESHDVICGLFPNLSGSENGNSPLKMVHLTAAAPAGPGGAPEPRSLRLGVVLSGGQASGGHNVIIGLHDYLQRWHPGSTLVGFLAGPRGVMQNIAYYSLL